MIVIGDQLNVLSNPMKRGPFNSKSKRLLRKLLICEAKTTKGPSLLSRIKIEVWSCRKRSCGLISPNIPWSRVMGASGLKEQ